MNDAIQCALDSQVHKEPLIGTAPEVQHWLLLEYAGAWHHDALEQSTIPTEVKENIKARLAEFPNSKFLFIKNNQKEAGFRFYYGIVENPLEPKFYQFSLSKYQDLMEIDLTDLDEIADYLHPDPFLLVCTNGRRDNCCAVWGQPIYQAIRQLETIEVWECSHVGQHRFAPNVLAFPASIYFAQIELDQISAFVASVLMNKLSLKYLRGRTAYSQAVQAAEYYLRTAFEWDAVFDGEVLEVERLGETDFKVGYRYQGKTTIAHVRRVETGETTLASCGDEKLIAIKPFELIEITE